MCIVTLYCAGHPLAPQDLQQHAPVADDDSGEEGGVSSDSEKDEDEEEEQQEGQGEGQDEGEGVGGQYRGGRDRASPYQSHLGCTLMRKMACTRSSATHCGHAHKGSRIAI